MGNTTKNIIGPADGWVKLTNGEDKGSLRHIRGGILKITQASAMPDDNAPEMDELSESCKSFVYFGLGANTDYLYGRAETVGVEFSVTPAVES